MIRALALLLLLCSVSSCSRSSSVPERAPKTIQRACYYWRSEFKLSEIERETLRSTHCTKVYVKFFDVVWDEREMHQARPVAPILWRDSVTRSISIIPTVFITEEALSRTALADIPKLAAHCLRAIHQLQRDTASQPTEVQFDCDWTERTREKYFLFLQKVREQLPVSTKLSATIRLHQIKYRAKTGMPPVDRGMLMYYNMSDWRNVDTKNSIFDQDAAERYIDYVHDYPLPLDLALPIFHWTLMYRNNMVLTMKNNVSEIDLRKQSAMHEVSHSKFAVDRDTLTLGIQLQRGDLLRAEDVPPDVLTAASDKILRRIAQPDLTIALFSLDEPSLLRYERSTFDSVFTASP